MKIKQVKRFVFLACYFLAIANNYAQNETWKAGIDSLFEKYNHDNVPGIAVSVNKDGKCVFQKGFGMANLEYGVPITEKTKFHVASLSKQFTAFLILKLEEEGKLSIDDDVRTYIPELPDYGQTITINHLLTHSSGIRDQWRLLEMAGWRLDDVIKTEQVFKLITNQKALNFSPGESFKYSNSGYTLMAIIVERLTKKSFADYARQSIFEPLQMDDSFFYDDHEEMVSNRAYSYKKVNDQLKKSNLNFATVGPTSLFTTLEDINKWAHNFESRIIGSKRIFKSMNQKARKNDGSVSSYAKGQFVRTYKGFKMIYHSGSDAGYRCYFARFPKLGYEFALFANASYINAYKEIFKVVDYYLQEQYPDKYNGDNEQEQEDFHYDDDLFVNLSNAEMKKFEGSYFDREQKQYWKVQVQNDTLYCKGGILQEDMILHPIGKERFKIKGSHYDISVNFKENDHNEPILEFRIPDIMWLWLMRVKAIDPSEYLGSYYNDELNAHYNLVERDNTLYLTHQKLDDIKIEQINEAFFSSNNRNFSNMRFKRNNKDEVIEFSVSNGGAENIIFSKK